MNTENLNWDGMADVVTDERTFGRIDHPYVGDVLPNGATVIAYHHEANGNGYVLAYVLKGVSGHEYATWRYAISANPTEFRDGIRTYYGRYFGNIFAASKDLARRAGVESFSLLYNQDAE